MNIDINDPKWTAYALDEIIDERERMDMEALIRQSPEIAAMVEEIRETAGWLKEELFEEPAERLTHAQRERIEAKVSKISSRGFLFGWRPVWVYAATAAAVIVVTLFAVRPFLQTDISRQDPVLTAEVFEKSFSDKTDGFVSSYSAEQPLNARVLVETTAPAHSASAQQTEIAEVLIADTGGTQQEVMNAPSAFAAPAATSVEIPSPVMDEPILFAAAEAAAGVGIATAVRGADAGIAALKSIGGMTLAETEPPYGRRPAGNFNTETYEPISDNPFLDVTQNPLSTFSIDVDTASYSNMRRFLDDGRLPPKDSIRIEELVNYFDYDYNTPRDGKPFAANVDMAEAPWNPENRLIRIGLKGREIAEGKRPDSSLVFLIDVSGSMAPQNRLPLVKDSMRMLVDRLTRSDRVAIVVYAGDTRVLLPSTRGDQKAALRNAIDNLRAGGSTNGASGIQLAYKTAEENFIKGGVNRVILATDGDFNVGVTNRGDLTRLIDEKAKSGIFLSALGFGMGNYKDATLELLADKGRGNYAYIDTENEARKVLVEQINSTLVAIAKDVKIQVEFNPRLVKSYRLIGYENRVMAKEDFNDDAKMAGVIGAGHAVTAFYELELAGMADAKPGVDPLKYQEPPRNSAAAAGRELATVKIRSKDPEKNDSVLTEFTVTDGAGRFADASGDFKFAAAVASFGMMLRDSPYKGNTDFESILGWAKAGKGEDRSGYREEFIRLVHRAASFPRR